MVDDKSYVVIGGRTFVRVRENETRVKNGYKESDVRRVNGMVEVLDAVATNSNR